MPRIVILFLILVLISPIAMIYGVLSDFKPSHEYSIASLVMSFFASFIVLHLVALFGLSDKNLPEQIHDKVIYYSVKLFSIAILIWLVFGFSAARVVNSIIGLESSMEFTVLEKRLQEGKGICIYQVEAETGKKYWFMPHFCAKQETWSNIEAANLITAEGVFSVLGFDIKKVYFYDREGKSYVLINQSG